MKNVLVTGGTRGLGLAICAQLKTDGYRVIAAGRTLTPALSAQIDADPSPSGGTIEYERLDLADLASLHPFTTDLVKRYGPLYGLINNAAIAHDGVLATMHDSQIDEVIHVNVTGTLVLTKYAIRPMLVSGSGRVVNISSIIASTGFNGLSVYAASKSAMIGFTRSLARELGKGGITVNAISPGYMQTDMSAGLDEKKLAAISRRSPMGKLVGVEDVAHAVTYLLSENAALVTGTNLTVDAGSTC